MVFINIEEVTITVFTFQVFCGAVHCKNSALSTTWKVLFILKGRIGDLAQHQYSTSVSLDDQEQERAVEGQF